MVRTLAPPIGEKRVVLPNVTWQGYQQVLHALPDTRAARLTYDCGVLEISMPLEEHEWASELIRSFYSYFGGGVRLTTEVDAVYDAGPG